MGIYQMGRPFIRKGKKYARAMLPFPGQLYAASKQIEFLHIKYAVNEK